MNKIIEITSINNPYIKDIIKLQTKKYRELNKKFIAEGYHLVEEAYNNKKLLEVLVCNEEDIKTFSNYDNIKIIKVTKEIINKISDTQTPQNVIGICEIKEKLIDYKNISKVLVLDNVSDPGNVGTLIRTSIGFNIDLIILSNNSVDVYNSKVVRSTQGAIFSQNIIYRNLVEEIKALKENDIKVISTSLESSVSLSKLDKPNKYAIILGNEANGVSKDIQNLSDQNVIIDINSKLESLNVSVAGSIMMYELNKK